MSYIAPVDEIMLLRSVFVAPGSIDSPNTEELDEDAVAAVLTEAGRFANRVLLPIDAQLDRHGARFQNGEVSTSPGHREAYAAFVDAGWMGVALPTKWGGQGLPLSINTACLEFWHSGSMAFAMGTLLTMGAAETIDLHAEEWIKQLYLPKLVTGEWTATMALTEPQSGSDLSGIRTRAERSDDGTYRIFGTKIFISYGEHDLTDNIVHLVLARLPGAPKGTRGISLFLVPKFITNESGSVRNDVGCIGIERKLGQHGSPTCTMSFGAVDGALGWLIGEPNKGLPAMFTMMNRARLAVATEGVAVAERAFQLALKHAAERRQGRTGPSQQEPSSIIDHPDVQRLLMIMRASASGARALMLLTADAIDRSRRALTDAERTAAQFDADLLTPIAKAYCTDVGTELASLAIQVHGGSGYIEETGVARLWRDVRIASIYEGTNGIQAIDLISRKLTADGGTAAQRLIAAFETDAEAVTRSEDAENAACGKLILAACGSLRRTTAYILTVSKQAPQAALFGASDYLRLFGLVASCAVLARAYNKCSLQNPLHDHLRRCLNIFARYLLADHLKLEPAITSGATLSADKSLMIAADHRG